MRLPVREAQPLVLANAGEGRDVAVVRSVDEQVVHVLERHEHRGGLVLPVHRRDRDDTLDGEVEVELLPEVVGIVLQLVERRGVCRGFAATGVAHEDDLLHVHLLRQWPGGRVVEPLPRLEVLEQEPGAAVVLAAEPVDEVFVNGDEDESARRHQLAEVAVARIGIVAGIVVAVHDQHQRERAGAVGIPHAPVERHRLHLEAPEVLARLHLRRRDRREWRHVHGLGLVGHRVLELGAVFVRARSVVHPAYRERARLGRVRRRDGLVREDGGRVVLRELERLGAGRREHRGAAGDQQARAGARA